MGSPHILPREDIPDFDPKTYYRFYNDVYPDNTISSGHGMDAAGKINMTIEETFSSSENWQLYYQQGRYFIRNYDYGADWQLGIDEGARSTPKLLQTTAKLDQQWILNQNDDGTWTLVNGLLGNGSFLALGSGNTIPGMQPGRKGASWDISSNPSAGQPKDTRMMFDLEDFEVEEPEPSASATTSTGSKPTSSILNASAASSLPSSTSSTGLTESKSSSSSSGLPTGAIAGIAVSVVLLVLLAAILGYLFWSRRRPRAKIQTEPQELAAPVPYEIAQGVPPEKGQGLLAHRAELG